MVGVETPRSWAVRFIDRPLTYSSTAATFRASGLPRVGVSVKFRPQPLHKERCLPRISPFLTCFALPQRLQHSSMTILLLSHGDGGIYAIPKPSFLELRPGVGADSAAPWRRGPKCQQMPFY